MVTYRDPHHGVGFSRARLAIGKYADVVTIECRPDDVQAEISEYLQATNYKDNFN